MNTYKKITFFTTFLVFFFNCIFILGSELVFPETEAEIVKALLGNEDKEVVISDELQYQSENGKIYKIINNKRFRLRGIQVAEAMDILPKVGALIHFDFDSAKIRKDSFKLLDEYGKALNRGLPKAVLMVVGHTDSMGTHDYNQSLSVKRAESVVDYLSTHFNVDSQRLVIEGKGESQPLMENTNDENRYKNRRVEFIRIE